MKKFISGLLTGVIITGSVTLAASYVADPVTFKVLVNGKEFTSDPPAMIINNSTYLPLRAMGNALGVPVEWNDELKQAEVGYTANPEAKINNTVQTSDKWKVTYTGYKTLSKVDDYTEAQNGKEFLIVFFDAENVSTETENFSLLNMDYYIDDVKTPQTILGTYIDGRLQLGAAAVESGKKVEGYMAFEVSPEWRKVDISYNEDFTKKDTKNAINFSLSK